MNVRRARNLWGSSSFRHSSPLARLLSVVVAIAVVALIGLVAGPASADGGAAGAAGAGSVGPSSLGSGSTSSTTTKSSSSSKSAGSAAGSAGKTALTSKKSFAAQVANLLPAALVVDCLPGTATIVGGFQIDGDTCAEGGEDWENTGLHVSDGLKDSTGFTLGSSENDDPLDWGLTHTPNGKTDVDDFWAFSKAINNTVYGFFGLTNDSTAGGTSQYDLEYNQLPAVAGDGGHPVPNRSAGDLLFRFSSTGADPIDFTDAKRYTNQDAPAWDDNKCFATDNVGGWCTIPIPANAFAQQVNADGTFFEGAIDIGLFTDNPGDCTGNFGVTSVRSVTGNSFESSSLKDYVEPLPVNTPSTCGSIVINKYDEGDTLVGGAHYTISPNPAPGVQNPDSLDVVDGGAGDADNTADGVITINPAEAGEYTVTETQAPTGYLLPDDVDQTLTLDPGAGESVTFNFHDPVKWQALTADKTANPTYTAQYAWSIAKEISADGSDPWVTDSSLLTPLLKNVLPNGDPTDGTPSYRVKVTAGARTTSDYAVGGTITVHNPNDGAVSANVSDALPGATCLVEGDATHTQSVPGNDQIVLDYACTFAGTPTENELSGTNTAKVTWDKSDYPQTEDDKTAVGDYEIDPTAGYAFGAETTSIDKTVTVTDDHHVFPGDFQVTWTAENDVTTSDTYTIPFQAVPGDCSAIIQNTATLTGEDSGVLGTSSAFGQICVPLGLGVSDTAVGDFTRTYNWSIDKFINGDQKSQTVTTSDLEATFDYTVVATPGAADDSAWVVTGTLTVTNPNQNALIDPLHVTGFSELLDLGVSADCTYDTDPGFDLASGEHADIGFTCTVPPTPTNDGAVPPNYLGNHQANVTWGDDGTATSDSAPLTWNPPTEVDKTLAVYDDKVTEGAAPVHLGDAVWNAEGTPTTFTYQLTFTVPGSTEGSCAPEFDNLAWLGGDGVTPTELQSGAAAVICVPAVIPPEPPKISPLPDTGGPSMQLLLWGLALLLTGSGVVLMTSRRNERRS